LHHEAGNDPVKDGAIVMLVLTYCKKLATVRGAFSAYSSASMSPTEVLMRTLLMPWLCACPLRGKSKPVSKDAPKAQATKKREIFMEWQAMALRGWL
jgi:hypothetical protein